MTADPPAPAPEPVCNHTNGPNAHSGPCLPEWGPKRSDHEMLMETAIESLLEPGK